MAFFKVVSSNNGVTFYELVKMEIAWEAHSEAGLINIYAKYITVNGEDTEESIRKIQYIVCVDEHKRTMDELASVWIGVVDYNLTNNSHLEIVENADSTVSFLMYNKQERKKYAFSFNVIQK